jgi:hypothetical protein
LGQKRDFSVGGWELWGRVATFHNRIARLLAENVNEWLIRPQTAPGGSTVPGAPLTVKSVWIVAHGRNEGPKNQKQNPSLLID